MKSHPSRSYASSLSYEQHHRTNVNANANANVNVNVNIPCKIHSNTAAATAATAMALSSNLKQQPPSSLLPLTQDMDTNANVSKLQGYDEITTSPIAIGKSGAKKRLVGASGATNKPWTQWTGTEKKDAIYSAWVTVRQVVSADTFQLALLKSPKQLFGPSKILTFTLEGIRTPRLARNDKTKEQPYAFEAREFVRRFVCTGTPVMCVAWNAVNEKTVSRYYGDMYLPVESKHLGDAKTNKESLTYLLVANGFAELNFREKTQLSAVEYDRLSKALEKAKKMKLGKFADGGDRVFGRSTQQDGDDDDNEEEEEEEDNNNNNNNNNNDNDNEDDINDENSREEEERLPYKEEKKVERGIISKSAHGKENKLKRMHVRKLVVIRTAEERRKVLAKYLNKDVPAIVDQVWSGSTLRLELLPNEKDDYVHELVPIHLAGCTAPRCRPPESASKDDVASKKRKAASTQTNHDTMATVSVKWSNEAKEFTEGRLLSQRVIVRIVTADQKSNLYGIVTHPKGQISTSLLRVGLAEYEPWTARLVASKDQKDMKEAVQMAQEKRLHIWQDKTPTQSHNVTTDTFIPVVVTQIVSGDTFVVQFPDHHEERFTFSSIRQPRWKEESKTIATTKKHLGGKNDDVVVVVAASSRHRDTFTKTSSSHLEHPWVRPAKGFLREKMLGKKVELLFEYEKELKHQHQYQHQHQHQPQSAAPKFKVQKFATVLISKELLIDIVNYSLCVHKHIYVYTYI
ncbi:hypothetical protein RFI_25053 [Reticulomyxa filosa]|uniref:TNase-like domain-containing protein n=1 Tax=Reticulomyxa filosa TaxID=46433 RepID=X6MF94_RETFI|nr:hypothetical protein RFI_25053 [Reticulomyxa filosa]|eukprot:ETO12321.1 hypothetical protein RFI_25053 [Reticulomyxa filosa]